MDIIKERLVQFAKAQGLMMMDFYKKISVAASNFSGEGANSALSTDKIVHILITYPELSADWLLLEKGEMLRKSTPKAQQQEEKVPSMAVSATAPSSNACNGNLTINAPQEIIMLLTSQQQTIQDLTSTIKILTTK